MEREKYIPIMRYQLQKRLATLIGASDQASEKGKQFGKRADRALDYEEIKNFHLREFSLARRVSM
jgi:hypothetical protein